MSASFDLDTYFAERRTLVDQTLDALLPATDPARDPGRLREGMRYAVLLGGKRMRPLLTIAACEAAGGQAAHALPGGCALEMIHAYSLVHDDLPAMDNDLERRGQPTVHVAFGHGNAILIGDALLTDAFRVLARGAEGMSRANMAEAVMVLSKHAGIDGMVGGQALDLVEGQSIDALERLEEVHAMKTGGLYAAAGALGALAAQASPEQVDRLERYGLAFGIAFQHADDILDDDQQALRERALQRIDELTDECRTIAAEFGSRGAALTAIADWVQARARRAAAGDRRD
ncbi:polyprenyl synthetase family protein [Nannocystaceae bacterium ST9]